MKRLKVISVLLTVAMCMSLITTPVSVLAEDSAAPSESQSAEPAEPKESETTKEKETKPSSDKKPEPSQEKETTSETSVAEPTKETESPDPSKEPTESKATEPSKSESNEAEETKNTETDKKAPAESEDSGNAPKESGETSVIEGKIPSQSDSTPKKNANSGTCGDNLTWEYIDGDLIISGSGPMYNYTESSTNIAPWYWLNFYNNISTVVFSGEISSIGDYAFNDFSSLETIVIPESVTSIGESAFSDSGLKSIVIPNSVKEIGYYAFCNCKNLTSVTIPKSITELKGSCFSRCSSLKSITIPDGVTKIDDYAFNSCTGLTNVTIPDSVTYLSGFNNCTNLTNISIPENVKTIGCFAFENDDNLVASLVIPNSVTRIERGAFANCTSLKNITIPNNVTYLSGFEGCTSLTSISIPKNVDIIGEYAFEGCKGLTSIEFSYGVTSIASWAFANCTGLKSVSIPNSVEYLDGFDGCTSLTSITIPNNVTHLSGFKGCTSLKNITIPESVTLIDAYAFSGCTGLTNITLPESVKDIYDGAFEKCTGLTSITIPGSIQGIWPDTFSGCSSLKNVTIPHSVRVIGEDAFAGCNAISDVYYDGSKSDWNYNVYCYDGNECLLNANVHFTSSSNTEEITFESETVNIAVGKKLTLKATGADDIAFKSSNKKIATVTATGVVSALKVGTVTITAYSKSDPSNKATCTVGVKYKLSYVLNGGTNSDENPEFYTGTIKLKNPTRQYYTFKGWYSDKKFKNKVTSVKNANKTLYAKWELNSYTIKFVANGGTGKMSNQKCSLTKEYKLTPNKFTKKGYSFTGWNTKADGSGTLYSNSLSFVNLTTTNGETIVLYAQWSINTYTINYQGLLEGTNNDNVKNYTVNTPTFNLISPSCVYHKFLGWYSDAKFKNKVTRITKGSTGNKTFYAKWALDSYTIKFIANGGTGKMDPQKCSVTKEYTLNANKFSKKGYSFDGWNTKADGTGTFYSKDLIFSNLSFTDGETINLYAQWKINNYTITYKDFPDTEKTTNDNKTSYTIKTDTFTFKPASCPGYVFKGWYSDSKHKKSITKITKGSIGNKTIYSKWTANKYTIKFDANGGTGKMSPMKDCVYGKEFPLTKNTFTAPNGKIFAGWNTKFDGSGTSYANCAKVKNLTSDKDGSVTLYAKWEPDNKLYWPVRDSNGNCIKDLSNRFMQNGHKGIDIDAPEDSKWYAAYSGKVVKVFTGCSSNGYDTSHSNCDPHCNGEPSGRTYFKEYDGYYCNNGFGNGIVIEAVINGTTYYIQYAHMKTVDTENIKAGMEIERGTYLGTVGDRGCSFGAHAHFEIDKDRLFGEPVNNDFPENGGIFEYYYD